MELRTFFSQSHAFVCCRRRRSACRSRRHLSADLNLGPDRAFADARLGRSADASVQRRRSEEEGGLCWRRFRRGYCGVWVSCGQEMWHERDRAGNIFVRKRGDSSGGRWRQRSLWAHVTNRPHGTRLPHNMVLVHLLLIFCSPLFHHN